jgi:hypothetical protein
MPSFTQILLLFVGLFFTTSAQFQFFEQMFGGGGQQQQQPQNVPSDSNWYRQNYEAGTLIFPTLLIYILIFEKHIAQTIFVPEPSLASISHTTAPAHTQIKKTKSN